MSLGQTVPKLYSLPMLIFCRSKQRNRNLDHKKVATMREKWSKTEGSNLQRTVIQHAVILTIKKEDSKGFLEQFKDAKGKSHDPNFLRISSMSPVNFTGQIFDLPESLTTVLKGSTILRCEAGQHRLEAIQSLEVGDHVGLWPAQIYLRDFSPAMLEALRRNVELISFRETTEDVLFKLSSYFPIEKSLTPADKKTFDSLYKTIGGKMRTSLNKEWGHLVKDITGVFPNFCQGWNENKASGLNKSIHNDVGQPNTPSPILNSDFFRKSRPGCLKSSDPWRFCFPKIIYEV